MGIAISAVDICNLALSELGNKPISNIITPTTLEETICAKHYDNTRRYVLRKHLWNFAKKRVVLSRSGTPEFEYEDQYPLPSDFIRIIKASSTGDEKYTDYDLANDYLLLHAGGATAINLIYVFDNKIVAKWDPMFVRLISLYLAKNMSFEITKKNSVKESILTEINLIEGEIKGIDGQDRPPRRVEQSNFIHKRSSLSNFAGKTYNDLFQ